MSKFDYFYLFVILALYFKKYLGGHGPQNNSRICLRVWHTCVYRFLIIVTIHQTLYLPARAIIIKVIKYDLWRNGYYLLVFLLPVGNRSYGIINKCILYYTLHYIRSLKIFFIFNLRFHVQVQNAQLLKLCTVYNCISISLYMSYISINENILSINSLIWLSVPKLTKNAQYDTKIVQVESLTLFSSIVVHQFPIHNTLSLDVYRPNKYIYYHWVI